MPEKLVAVFKFERETKNTVRFSELPEGPPIVNTIYVQKWAVKQLGDPQKIRVTIERVDE